MWWLNVLSSGDVAEVPDLKPLEREDMYLERLETRLEVIWALEQWGDDRNDE